MATTTPQITALVALTLPGTPDSARKARFHIRAALGHDGLDGYADDAEAIASELVSNAVTHGGATTFTLELVRLEGTRALAVIVTDTSPQPPLKRHPPGDAEHGRGLLIVDALSASWGWRPCRHGKAVYAILIRER